MRTALQVAREQRRDQHERQHQTGVPDADRHGAVVDEPRRGRHRAARSAPGRRVPFPPRTERAPRRRTPRSCPAAARARQPSGQQRRTRRGARARGQLASQAMRAERRDRQRAQHRRPGDRREPPGRDQQQHGQEQRAHKRAEQQSQREVRRHAPGPAGDPRCGCEWDSVAAISASSAIGAWKTKIARQSNSCVSTPPSAGPSAAPNVPAAIHTASPRPRDPREHGQQRERAGKQHRRARTLQAPKDDQRRQAPRRRRAHRPDAEQEQPRPGQLPRVDPPDHRESARTRSRRAPRCRT